MNARILILVLLLVFGVVVLIATWPRSRSAPPAPIEEAGLREPDGGNRFPDLSDSRESPALPPILQQLLDSLSARDSRENEAVLSFADRAALDAFLARASAAGLEVLATIDALNAARVRFASAADLQNDILEHIDDYADLNANALMQLPVFVPIDARTAVDLVPLGNRLLEFLGITDDSSRWGAGVTLAIIDTAVASDPTFGEGRLVTLDLGLGLTAAADIDGHGTAVAALAAGAAGDARGVAPATTILSVPVVGADGLSDSFTVAQAIIMATDAGAQILNISLGTYQQSSVLQRAIDYALARNVVIVASAGNDQAAQLTWPAADPRVVSVGAVDALHQQVTFSNSGPQLQIAAPGYGVQTAWAEGSRVLLDGTSASAPIIAGALAALMSENRGMTADQAWAVLRQFSAEAGAAGTDPNYGHGVIDLGWAVARNDYTRIDTAISSQTYNAAAGHLEFVVQNRSANVMAGLTLQIEIDGVAREVLLAPMDPGAVTVTSVPFDATQTPSASPVTILTRLVNPRGTIDANPSNNVRSSSLLPPAPVP